MFNHSKPVFSLLFLSPLIAEFLLGNISIDAVWVLPVIAPLYGGGAILIREVARRYPGSWSKIFLLALAFAIFVEALVTQSLFNPSYFGFDLHQFAHINSLGVGAWWTIYVLTIHTVWSIAVPIALVEALFPDRANKPWLGDGGLLVVSLVFLLGAAINFGTTWHQEKFIASVLQLSIAGVVCVVVIAATFFLPRNTGNADNNKVISYWWPGIFSLLACSIFSLGLYLPGWLVVVIWLLLVAVALVFILQWSAYKSWSLKHRFTLMGGALLTYAWQGFPHTPVLGSGGVVDWIGNTVFALGSVLLLVVAWRVLNMEKSGADL